MNPTETPSRPASAPAVAIGGKVLARNTLLNVAGKVAPLLVGLATIPYIIRGLGMERFGILSLAWVVVGYFSLFSLGLGPATVKFVAELLGKGDSHRLPAVVWTAFSLQAALGLAGGSTLAIATPVLTHRFLHVSPELAAEVQTVFLILAASIPIVFVMGVFRGVLEASQRFDLVNAVSVPSSALSYLIPAAGLALGLGLRGIVFLLVLSKLAAAIAYLVIDLRFFPDLRKRFTIDRKILRPLLSYGGWVSVSNALSPLFTYAERLVIASLVSFSAVGIYTAPHEMLSRAFIFPASIGMTVFPAYSVYGRQRAPEVARLFSQSVKWLLLVTTPIVIVLAVFAKSILQLWLGQKFASQGVVVFQILAFAYFVSAFGQMAFAVIYGLGRPDLKAKVDLVMLPLYLGLSYVLILGFGINGAATAKLVITMINVTCLIWVAKRLSGFSLQKMFFETLARGVAVSLAFAAAASVLVFSCHSLFLLIAAMTACTGIYLVSQWKLVLDTGERAVVLSLSSRLLNRSTVAG